MDDNFDVKSNQNDLVTIYKVKEISSSHILNLPYESKCNRMHGHNFKIEVWVTGTLNEYGMIIDFNDLGKEIMNLDHVHLNDFLDKPTAENIAIYLKNKILKIASDRVKQLKIRVWETSSAYAEV